MLASQGVNRSDLLRFSGARRGVLGIEKDGGVGQKRQAQIGIERIFIGEEFGVPRDNLAGERVPFLHGVRTAKQHMVVVFLVGGVGK